MATAPDGKLLAWMALACCVACSTTDSMAQSADIPVSATIAPGCAVDGLGTTGNAGIVGRLEFGSASAQFSGSRTADITATQSIVLRCSTGVALQMSLDGGQHAGGGERHLRRTNGTEQIAYQVYRDSGYAQPIGIGQTQAITVTSMSSNNVRLPVYARVVLSGPDARLPAGSYADTLLVTLSW